MFFSIFRAIEGTGLSIWIRESDSIFSFWLILSVHAIGMGVAVGASVLIGLGILGLAPDLPLASVKSFSALHGLGSGHKWYPARFY